MKITDKTYNELDAIRRSDLWKIKQSPLHFKYFMDNEEEDAKALEFGIAMHMALLEWEQFELEYSILPKFDKRTKQGKSDYENFLIRNEGKRFLTLEEKEQIIAMRSAVMSHPVAKELITNSVTREEAFLTTDSETGEKVKVKADIITKYNGHDYIVDYKTTQSCKDRAFESSVKKYGYKFQAGFYTDVIEQCNLQRYRFAFIGQEKTAPYAVRVYWCDDDFVRAGKVEYHNLLRLYHHCKETDTWNGYTDVELLEEDYN